VKNYESRTVVVSTVCVRDVCECALISVPKSTTSSASFDDFSTTVGAVRVTCRDCVRTVAVVVSDGLRDGYNATGTCDNVYRPTQHIIGHFGDEFTS